MAEDDSVLLTKYCSQEGWFGQKKKKKCMGEELKTWDVGAGEGREREEGWRDGCKHPGSPWRGLAGCGCRE